MSRKRSKGKGASFACWHCGGRMKKADLVCKPCRETQPAAVKAQLVTLRKSFGGRVNPVAVPPVKTVVKAASTRPQTAEEARRERLMRDLCHPDAMVRNVAHYELHPEIRPPWEQS